MVKLLNAKKVIGNNYYFSDVTQILTIYIVVSKLGFRRKKESKVSYQLQIDDCACSTITSCNNETWYGKPKCTTTCPNYVREDISCDGVPLPTSLKNTLPSFCECCYNESKETLNCACNPKCQNGFTQTLTNVTSTSTIYFCHNPFTNSTLSTTPCPSSSS